MKRFIVAALAAAALAACASGPTGSEATQRFDNFSAKGSTDFTSFEQVYVEPAQAGPKVTNRYDARPGPTRRVRPIGESEVENQLTDLTGSIERAMSGTAALAEGSGPGILTIRTTLLDIVANRPTQRELALSPGLDFRSTYAGASEVRIELLENGQVLAVIEDSETDFGINDPRRVDPSVFATARQHFDEIGRDLAALLQD